MRRKILWLAATSIVVGCSDRDPVVDYTTTIEGVVVNLAGSPIEGAQISTQPALATVETKSNGTFAVGNARYAVLYVVTAEAAGYHPQTQPITPDVQSDNKLRFELESVVACSAGRTRCATDGIEGVETCNTEGTEWVKIECGTDQVCDPSTTQCTNAHVLRVATVGEGSGAIVSSPGGINCGQNCSKAFIEGTEVTLTASPFTFSSFERWLDPGCRDCGSNPVCVVTMDQAQACSAHFSATGFSVTVTMVGDWQQGPASVTSTPVGVTCRGDTCGPGIFDRDTTVTLNSFPRSVSFDGWSGDCVGVNRDCTLVLDGHKQVTATFSMPSFPLTVQRAGTGAGRVTSNPSGIDCGSDCDEDFPENEIVTLTSSAATGSTFEGWSGDCTGTADCTVTLDQARTVTATFDGISYPLDVSLLGTGVGTVTSSPSGINCGTDCTESYGPGTTVGLLSSPDGISSFSGWGGACSGMASMCLVTMDSAQSVTATFDSSNFSLNVTVNGNGTVTSPSGINCGTDCAESLAGGTPVTLTANPDPQFVFTSWGGACSASGSNPVCSITINGTTDVSANFDPFYMSPLAADGDCLTLLHFDAPTPLAQGCGGGADAVLNGTYSVVASRTVALGDAYSAGAGTGYIDTMKPGATAPAGTVELTCRKSGAAIGGSYGVLFSDLDTGDSGTSGVRLFVLDDGTLSLATSNGVVTSTVTSAPGTIVDGTFHHVAATMSGTGVSLFVDGSPVAQDGTAPPWVASSSTAWVGAERDGTDSTNRFNGILDEVRVSSTEKY